MLLLDGAKLAIYGLFLNYYCYYVVKGAFIPHGTILFLAVAFLCILFSVIDQDGGNIYIGKEVICWTIYGVLAFGFSMTLCNMGESSSLYSDIFKYFQRLLMIQMIAYICEKERSIRFGLRLLVVSALGCAIAIFNTLGSYQLKLDITSGANISANDVGALMAFGIIAVLLYGSNDERPSPVILTVFKSAIVIACGCVIFLAGSRKSIIAVILFLLLVILFCGVDFFRNVSMVRFLCLAVIISIAIFFVYKQLWQYVEGTNLYTRTLGRGAEAAAASNDSRLDLYILALQEFMQHPLIGLGFNNFGNIHGNYTHSTYVEPLACSGLIGLLYLFPYARLFFKQLNIIRAYPPRTHGRTWQKSVIIFFIAFAFVGVGIPFIYKDIPCILLGMFIASQQIAYDDLYYNWGV